MQKKELRRRRFVAKYIHYLTVFGYLFVASMGVTVAALWFVKIDEVSEASGVFDKPDGKIYPDERTLERPTDLIVLDVLVPTHAAVAKGQALVEICDDPAWVKRYRSAQSDYPEQLSEIRSEIPVTLVDRLLAPISGTAVVWEEMAGTIVPARQRIAKVIDFENLTIRKDFEGANVRDIREGQEVKVELHPTYGYWETLLGDVAYPGWWREGRARFNSVAAGTIRDMLQKRLEGRPVALENSGKTEDAPFKLTELQSVEMQGTLLADEPPEDRRLEGVEAEPLLETVLTGIVVEATHRAKANIRDLPDDLTAEIRKTLLDRLQAGISLYDSSLSTVDGLRSKIEWPPLARLRSGLRGDNTAALTVADIDDLEIIVNMKAEYRESDKAGDSSEETLLVEQTERKCWVVTKLVDPPALLQAKVRALALADAPSHIAVSLKVVVGEQRIAMLLFRKN